MQTSDPVIRQSCCSQLTTAVDQIFEWRSQSQIGEIMCNSHE